MPRYVILLHETSAGSPRPTHYDLMLEWGDVLRTWALDAPPTDGKVVAGTALADHRRAYLEYEGEISGGRGTVTKWDAGSYTLEHASEQKLVVVLSGRQFEGALTGIAHGARWEFRYEAASSANAASE